ncbi:MAG: nucleotidyltransferase family protein [Pseudomonadota bacterium]
MISDTDLPRDTLLALCAGAGESVSESDWHALSPEQWEWVQNRARAYRLLPLLHAAFARQPDWPVPDTVQEAALESHRMWVFRSLIMQQALIEIGELFDAHRIPYAALKGASLSLEFYAEPALRPMRDLDIMVAPDMAEHAYSILQEAGYSKEPGKGDYGLDFAHHLPLLANKNRVFLELHHRIAPREWSGSLALAQRLMTNARIVDFQGHQVRMAHPTDTFLHLVVHASFQHLFDNGANLLSDVAALQSTGLIDRAEVDAFASEHGLTQSVALVDALVARYRDGASGDAPPGMIAQAAELMTQDPDLHWQRFLLRKRRSPVQRLVEGVGRAFTPNAKDLEEVAGKPVTGTAALLYYPSWLFQRARVYLGAEFQSELDSQAAKDAELERWIGRPVSMESEG